MRTAATPSTFARQMITRRGFTRFCAAFAVACCVFAASTSLAAAAPQLKVTPVGPDYVLPGSPFAMFLNVQNVGDQPMDGLLNVDITYPDGVTPGEPQTFNSPADPECSTSGQSVACTIAVTGVESGVQLRYRIDAAVDGSASGPLAGGLIEVSGGGSSDIYSQPLDIFAGPAGPFALKSLDVEMRAGENGPAANQAGSDPAEITTRFASLSQATATFGIPVPETLLIAPTENFRDVVVHVPAGLVGNPNATPIRCTRAQLAAFAFINGQKFGVPACPPESQVGVAQLNTGDIVGVFNVTPPPGAPAAFGFFYNSIVTTMLAKVRPSDHGIDISVADAVSSVPLPKVEVSLWGAPTDAFHDHLRGICLQGGAGYTGADCSLKSRSDLGFLRMPTSCSGAPLPWKIEMDTYQHPGTFVSKATTSPPVEGCSKVPFDPSLSLAPSSAAAGSPSGLDVSVSMPQDSGAKGLGQADLRSATVELPQGVAINPASADGLAACTDGQLRLGLDGPATCPDASKIGSLELDTPLLEEQIGGAVYLRSQASDDPESGDLFRLALEIRSDERGIAIKLPGSLVVDEETGRLTTRFEGLPQLPFEAMRLHLKSGPRAPLITPSACGTYSAHAVLEGWNGKTEAVDPKFTIDQNCTPAPFDPGFEAGVADSTAGEFAPFSLRVTRGAGQPNVSRIDATLPEGELAKLAGVPVCSDAQSSAGGCPAASRIGHVIAGIGEGTSPLYLPQVGRAPTAVYLAGPYKGAPYSILAAVPAQAGPFDLGTVVVRSALRVDPVTTQASVLSDPLPQIYAGVPVAYRDVRVLVDRPQFTLNPTDCEPTEVRGTIASLTGQRAEVSDRFQVADCAALGFKPKLAISLSGQTRRAGNPALRAVLQIPRKGDYANISRAVVTLPGSEFIAQDHLSNVCTRVQYAADGGGGAGCPKGSAYGRARAFTPLLDQPLEGPVYLRSNGGERELPDLVASLDGAIHVDLVGYIDSDKRTGGLRTTFARVPDAPVSKFVLKMPGGKKSLLENSTDICRRKHRASVKMDGQNGRVHDFRPLVKARCGSVARGR